MWDTLRRRGVNRDDFYEVGKLGVARPVTRYFSHDQSTSLVLEIARSEQGKLRIQREVHGRRWARRSGIPTVETLACSESGEWMLSRWSKSTAFETHESATAYIDAALECAQRIAASPPPLDGPQPQRWRSPAHTVLLRTLRGVLGGLPLRAWFAARKAACALPCVPVAHGDFYHRNLPYTDGAVAVVDWEYLGEHPRYSDQVRFWSVLPTRELRQYALKVLLEQVPAAHHDHLRALARWLALRRLGENLKAPRRQRNAADTAHAREVVNEVLAE